MTSGLAILGPSTSRSMEGETHRHKILYQEMALNEADSKRQLDGQRTESQSSQENNDSNKALLNFFSFLIYLFVSNLDALRMIS